MRGLAVWHRRAVLHSPCVKAAAAEGRESLRLCLPPLTHCFAHPSQQPESCVAVPAAAHLCAASQPRHCYQRGFIVSHPVRWCGAIGGIAIPGIEKNGRSYGLPMTFQSNASLQILIHSSRPQHGCLPPVLPTCYFSPIIPQFLASGQMRGRHPHGRSGELVARLQCSAMVQR